jgi:ribosomal protection tetracycline resistance protein
VLDEIEQRLTPDVVPMGSAEELGSRAASFASFGAADGDLAERARAGTLHPVFFGSALTGAGVEEVRGGIAQLLPARAGDGDAPLSARVFKIERGPDGDRIAYARVFSGAVTVRDRFDAGKVTAIRVFAEGDAVQRDAVQAGEIAKLWGLAGVRIGDWLGEPRGAVEHHFAPPTFESVVAPVDPADGQRLRVALGQLAEQDPLIDVRQDDERAEISVSLYGEVQREVIESTLADEYGLAVAFRETTTICVERPTGSGEAIEILNTPTNPFHADLGLRIEPAATGSGVDVVAAPGLDPRDAPLYTFKTFDAFVEHMGEYVRLALTEGLFGWQVTDCAVTVTKIAYSLADGPPSRRGPMPTSRDMKRLTPLVLMQALAEAGTAVCEPVFRIAAEVPTEAIGAMLAALGRLGAGATTPSTRGELSVLEATLPASRVQELRRQLPGLTGGEGVIDSEFAGYQPVTGEPPTRKRLTPDPRNLDEYLAQVGR